MMTLNQRASQLWTLLTVAALERKSYTYGNLAAILGFDKAGTMGSFLEPIMRLCVQRGWPPLTIIVVNAETGAPGVGLDTIQDLNRDRERVYRFNWFTLEPPQIEDFKRATEPGA